MDSIIRALIVYAFLLAIFRISGKHSLGHITTFDLVLTLIISEAIQQALVDTDNSMTNALLLVTTLVGANIVLSLVKQRWTTAEKIIDGTPVILMERGQLCHDRMNKERVDEANILGAAREQEGIERLDQIDYAILEGSGGITVVPKRQPEREPRRTPERKPQRHPQPGARTRPHASPATERSARVAD